MRNYFCNVGPKYVCLAGQIRVKYVNSMLKNRAAGHMLPSPGVWYE